MMSSSRAGLRSRPGVVREGRPLPKNTATKAARSARPTAAQRRREATPISVPPSPSTPTRRVTAGSRAPFIVLVLVLAAGGLIGLVLLNTAVNENAFRLHDLDTEQSRLDKEEQRLQQALQDQESPKKLADRAKDLGLVPAGGPRVRRAARGEGRGDAGSGQGSAVAHSVRGLAPYLVVPVLGRRNRRHGRGRDVRGRDGRGRRGRQWCGR